MQCRHHSRCNDQFLPRKTPAVTGAAPAGQGIVVVTGIQSRISEDLPVDPVFHGLPDLRCHGKLHVGDPHADEILIRNIKGLVVSGPEDVSTETVGIQCVGIAAVDDRVKIIMCHTRVLFFRFPSLYHPPSPVTTEFHFQYFSTGVDGSGKPCYFVLVTVLNVLIQLTQRKAVIL